MNEHTAPHDPSAAGAPPAAPPPPRPAPSGTDSFFDAIRRAGIVRSEERWVGGVGGGVALRLGIDPLIVRGILGVAVLLGGLGLVLYGLGWLLLPEERDGRIHVQQMFRGDFDIAVLGGFVVFVSGLSYPDRWHAGTWWGPVGGWWQGFLWISAIIVIVVLIVSASSKDRGSTPAAGTTAPGPYGPFGTSAPPPPPFASAAGGSSPTATTSAQPAAPPPPPQSGGAWSGAHGSADSGPGGSGSGGHGSGTWSDASAPQYGPVPTARPVRRGPGAAALGLVVALSLLTFAGLLYADRTGAFDGPVVLTAGAVSVVLLGLAVIVAGLRGRTSGGLGSLAVLVVLVLLPVAALHGADWDGGWGTSTAIGELIETPVDTARAEDGYVVGAGEVRLDLTELALDDGPIEVPLRVGAGEITVILPEGSAFTADITVMAGEVQWLDDRATTGVGVGGRSYESAAVEDGAPSEIDLSITVGAGSVRVLEER